MVISIHMGHKIDVALKYYVSAILSEEDKIKVKAIMGDILT